MALVATHMTKVEYLHEDTSKESSSNEDTEPSLRLQGNRYVIIVIRKTGWHTDVELGRIKR